MRHVQGADRLVADDEVRLEGQGPGDADPLALAAGELVRVAVGVGGGQAHALQQFAHAAAPLAAAGQAVDGQRLADDAARRSCAG